MEIFSRGKLTNLWPMESAANAGSELDKLFAEATGGVGSTFSELGFWNPEMLPGAVSALMGQEEGKRRAETARQVARTHGASQEQAALYNALAGLYGHQAAAEASRYAADRGEAGAIQRQRLANQGALDTQTSKNTSLESIARENQRIAEANQKMGNADLFNAALKQARKERGGLPEDAYTQRALEIMGRPASKQVGRVTPEQPQGGGGLPGNGLYEKMGPMLQSGAKGAMMANPSYAMLQALPYIMQYMQGPVAGGE